MLWYYIHFEDKHQVYWVTGFPGNNLQAPPCGRGRRCRRRTQPCGMRLGWSNQNTWIYWIWWILMNMDEHWWTLMNIDEHGWTLMNMDEHWWTLMNSFRPKPFTKTSLFIISWVETDMPMNRWLTQRVSQTHSSGNPWVCWKHAAAHQSMRRKGLGVLSARSFHSFGGLNIQSWITPSMAHNRNLVPNLDQIVINLGNLLALLPTHETTLRCLLYRRW